MSIKTPVLDNRASEDIYKQALELVRRYCPEVAIPDDERYFSPDDPSLVILKLFSKSAEFLVTQFNKIPDKNRLAFFDFMGIDLLPARPSRVPLTFYLTGGSSGGFVPLCTKVASSEDPDLIFETTEGLSVVPAKLNAVFSLNPWEDNYTDHSTLVSGKEEGFLVFGEDLEENSCDHILCLGDDTLFDIRRPPSDLKLHLTGYHLSEKYFSRWCDVHKIPLGPPEINRNQDATELDITFNDKARSIQTIQRLERSAISGTESFWLSVRPGEEVKIVKGVELPKILKIVTDIVVEGILPEATFFNDALIDVKKGFYPFGEQPKRGDSLFIGSEEAFSKEGAEVRLGIALEAPVENSAALLKWEYWNGTGWEVLKVLDNTDALKRSHDVVIETCPFIPVIEINGLLNRWVRVRIVSENGYGAAGKYEPKKAGTIVGRLSHKLKKAEKKNGDGQDRITSGFEYTPPTYTPPFIQALTISYSYKDAELGRVKAFNNFQYKELPSKHPREPYEVSKEEMPSFYLGFKENIAGVPLTLFFAVKEKLFNEAPKRIKNQGYPDDLKYLDEATGLAWKYYNGVSWEEFSVDDETDHLRSGGIVRFLVPSDIESTSEFGVELHWIKAELKDGMWAVCPRLKGIFLNTVWALNSVTIRDEILGSGNGEPNLTVTFSSEPVLEGQVIEVQEANIPTKDELKTLESERGKDAVRIIEEAGEIKEVWVRWNEVKNFALSGPLSRHYVLDREQGTITFGDGVRGIVPPIGKNNIIARYYRTGGGVRGDVASGTITSLKRTIPYIDRVINHVSSSGGMDQEIIERAVNRGPHTIKNRNRAVTAEDFEWLALGASQYVARAKCLAKNGNITVVIVPKYESDAPLPDAGLLDSVARYIKDRAFFTVINRIEFVGPEYKVIDAYVKVKPVLPGESTLVSDRIKERLKTFLHPLKGGPRGEGWDFGQAMVTSEVAAVIDDIAGVDYVKELVLKKEEKGTIEEATGVDQLLMEPNALPCAGVLHVEIEG